MHIFISSVVISFIMLSCLLAEKNWTENSSFWNDLLPLIKISTYAEFSDLSNSVLNPKNITKTPKSKYQEFFVLQGKGSGINYFFKGMAKQEYGSSLDKNFHELDNKLIIRELSYTAPSLYGLSLNFGKIIENWSVSYSRNFVNFYDKQGTINDVNDMLYETEGIISGIVRYNHDIFSADFYYADDSLENDMADNKWTNYPNAVGVGQYGGRLSYSGGNFLPFIVFNKEENSNGKYGGGFTYTPNDALELHGEFLSFKGNKKKYHKDAINGSITNFIGNNISMYDAIYSNSDKIFTQYLLGGQYTFSNSMSLMLEYSYDRTGYTKKQWDNYVNSVESHLLLGYQGLAYGNLGADAKILNPLGVARQYIFARASYSPSTIFEGMEIALQSNINLNDYSSNNQFEIFYSKEYVDIKMKYKVMLGKDATEYGLNFTEQAVSVVVSFKYDLVG